MPPAQAPVENDDGGEENESSSDSDSTDSEASSDTDPDSDPDEEDEAPEIIIDNLNEVTLPYPALMHTNGESRYVMQESPIVNFDVDNNGAWLRPHRVFDPYSDVIMVQFDDFLGHMDDFLRLSPNFRPLVNQLPHNHAGDLHTPECPRCRYIWDQWMQTLNGEMMRMWHEYSDERRSSRRTANIHVLFQRMSGESPNDAAVLTSMRMVCLHPNLHILQEMRTPAAVFLGGEDCGFTFVIPNAQYRVIYAWEWPA